MSSSAIHACLDGLWNVIQRRSYSRSELARWRAALLDETTRLVQAVEHQRELTTMLRWRSREQARTIRQLRAALEHERSIRAVETERWKERVAHLQMQYEQERRRADMLTVGRSRSRRRMRSAGTSPRLPEGRRLVISSPSELKHDAALLMVPTESRTQALLSPPHSPERHGPCEEEEEVEQHSVTTPTSIQRLNYIRYEEDAASTTTADSSILADVPRTMMQLTDAEVRAAVARQNDADLSDYFWSRCTYQCSCDEAMRKENANDAPRETSVLTPLVEHDTFVFREFQTEPLHVCRMPTVEFDEMIHVPSLDAISESEALRKSLVETIHDIETVLRRHHTTLRELNQEIHKNRSQLRDAQRDIIRLQKAAIEMESKLDQMRQKSRTMNHHIVDEQFNEHIQQLQISIENIHHEKEQTTRLLQSLRQEEQTLRQQKRQLEQDIHDIEQEIRHFHMANAHVDG